MDDQHAHRRAMMPTMTIGFLDRARRQTVQMHRRLQELVECESPSNDPDALRECADLLTAQWAEASGRPLVHIERDGRRHLTWDGGATPAVLLLGHYDTVWPRGTIPDWPFTERDGIIRGPGVLDMKAGIVQMLSAVELLGDQAEHVTVLLTADEEVGSPSSRDLIEEAARRAGAVLVCEPATPDGAVKIARRGVAHYRLTAVGKAAHAGEEPEHGINAAIEIARQIPTIASLASTENDTTVTPTVLRAGNTVNSVPERGTIDVDVRAWTRDELERVDRQIRLLQPELEGSRLQVNGGIDRRPFEPALTASLTEALADGAADIGLQAPTTAVWRSASDANITAGIDVPTLDGLGAVGAHPHGRDEHIIAATVPDRAALLAACVRTLVERKSS
jgi:glutamate carboxypeptidase